MTDETKFYIVNAEAFDFTDEMLQGVMDNKELWDYFGEEARYCADKLPVKPDDIRCAILNGGSVDIVDGQVFLEDFDARYFKYTWNGKSWVKV